MVSPETNSLRDKLQPCVEIYPGWRLASADSEYISLYSPRNGLELTLPGSEIDPDDWEDITDVQNEALRADEIEAKVIFRCIQDKLLDRAK